METNTTTLAGLVAALCRENYPSTFALAAAAGVREGSVLGLLNGTRVPAAEVRSIVTTLGITPEMVRALSNVTEALAYMWCKEIGEHLKSQRRTVTTAQIAAKLGVNTSTILRWESASARPSDVGALIVAYGVDANELLQIGLWPPVQYPGITRVGRVLQEHRTRTGASQKAFARSLGVNEHTYRAWETGGAQPNAENLRTIARTLGVKPSELREHIIRKERHKPDRSEFSSMLMAHRKEHGLAREDIARANRIRVEQLMAFENLEGTPMYSTVRTAMKWYGLSKEQVLPFLVGELDDSTFGSWLRSSRKAAMLSVYDVEARAGVSRNTMGFYESDRIRPGTTTAVALARAFGVPVREMRERLAKAGPGTPGPFAEFVAESIRCSGKSSADVAAAYGVIPQAISGLLRGMWMPSPAKLPALAAALSVEPAALQGAWQRTKDARNGEITTQAA
jgi:transcriptional regulator with XRE-family HTH domain